MAPAATARPLARGRRALAAVLAVARGRAGQQVGCQLAIDVAQERREGGIALAGTADLRPQIQALQFLNTVQAVAQIFRPRIAGGLTHPGDELAGECAHPMAVDSAAAPEVVVAASE